MTQMSLNVSIIQMNSQGVRSANLANVLSRCKQAIKHGSQLIVLPEVFSLRSETLSIQEKSEDIQGESIQQLVSIARQYAVWIVGGSIYERCSHSKKAYNTSVVISNKGKITAKYRKIHLFDAGIDQVRIQESNDFLEGDCPVITPIHGILTGLSICYDLRFPELYRYYSRQGAKMICVPSAFTRPTGKRHWEVLLRARAIENQCFILAPNQVGRGAGGIPSYGHSMVIGPDGNMIVSNRLLHPLVQSSIDGMA